MNKKKSDGSLTERLDALPRLTFTRGPASTPSDERQVSRVYGVTSISTLVEEFDRRERRLRSLAKK